MFSHSTLNALLCMMMTFCIKFTSDMTTMALLDMVSRNDTTISLDTLDQNHTCPTTNQLAEGGMNITTNSTKMNWSEYQIGKVQGIYFYGYIASMVIGVDLLLGFMGSYMAIVMIGVVSAIVTLTFPFFILQFGYSGALAGRLLLGLVQGPATSLLAVTVKQWSTEVNLTFTITLATLGAGMSCAVILFVDGNAINSGIGWIALYHIHGSISLLLTLIYLCFGDNDPNGSTFWFDRYRPFRLSKTIGWHEKVSIVSSGTASTATRHKMPWIQLLGSCDVQIVSVAWFCFESACKFSLAQVSQSCPSL